MHERKNNSAGGVQINRKQIPKDNNVCTGVSGSLAFRKIVYNVLEAFSVGKPFYREKNRLRGLLKARLQIMCIGICLYKYYFAQKLNTHHSFADKNYNTTNVRLLKFTQ